MNEEVKITKDECNNIIKNSYYYTKTGLKIEGIEINKAIKFSEVDIGI